jgi:hypothetical protein
VAGAAELPSMPPLRVPVQLGGIMELAAGFSFQPIPPIEDPETTAAPAADEAAAVSEPAADRLGPLVGRWTGEGFNVIWRPHPPPHHGQLDGDHVLELNRTTEQLDFERIPGTIPNRGLLQRNINLHGLTYLQQIFDAHPPGAPGNPKGQHLEPGLWVIVPQTDDPHEPQTVARLASIPHGTTILAQGTAQGPDPGGPHIPAVSIRPFPIGQPGNEQDLVEQHVNADSDFRIPRHPKRHGMTQRMVDNPNSFLTDPVPVIVPGPAAPPHTPPVATTTTLQVSTHDRSLPGGGAANIAFLKGIDGPNAVTSFVTATFWLQTFQGDPEPRRLQYSQLVLLDFNGFSWPHVTVATLRKAS